MMLRLISAGVGGQDPIADAESREAARMHLTYHKEVGFYRDLAGVVSVPHPMVRYAVIDAASGDFTLLMHQAHGDVGDQLAGCSLADATAMVDAAVGLHARPGGGRPNSQMMGGLRSLTRQGIDETGDLLDAAPRIYRSLPASTSDRRNGCRSMVG